MRQPIKVFCGAVACLLVLTLLDSKPPCACRILCINPRARWRIEAVYTPYSDGKAGHIEERDCGYQSVMMYTCNHGIRLTVIMDTDTKECWGSIND